ncbi:Sugar kinase of the NBD/HSP70 family, may contain an N-terminal HTH domain [Actinopolymorpha cephalotaxi]|uniref:NBD/HSP70 family sugar kinase n=1 Tax=Actinopolymorpha cephalotaxi TaxID=504797 RepID=A0A1I2PNG9_9ACTN|nr:ROK family transcriptional regulator [Actinopolymorpha cephalotaxi]NYH83553.1 putative NBD/HSP70 family sugar kinase [Actinopolymorpha cephalotaxi]SFG17100.1 Sugar kinase of the NBD/HSP70 family, may contain an N-terminal HTH domain [Actinopolymorpha cephalotaxi]
MLAAVRAHGVLSQAEIARITGLSPASVSNIVHQLADADAVELSPGIRGGRRAQEVRVRSDGGLVVGLDFGHRHIRVAVSDLRFVVRAERRVECDVGASALSALAVAERLVGELLDEIGTTRCGVRAVGLGLPAPMGPDGGTLAAWPILPSWATIDPARHLAKRLGAPVYADNDANLGARGELYFGAGRGVSDLAYIKAATGLGAGLVVAGNVYRGFAGSAGEIGHLTIDEMGPVCSCGNRGCLETMVGAPYLLELIRHSHPDVRTVEQLVTCALAGDGGCRRVVADAGRHIGFVAANLCNVVNPERVVVGGDLAAAGDLLLEPLRSAMPRYAVVTVASTPVVAALTGERAEVLGALVLAVEQFQRRHDQAEGADVPADDPGREVPSGDDAGVNDPGRDPAGRDSARDSAGEAVRDGSGDPGFRTEAGLANGHHPAVSGPAPDLGPAGRSPVSGPA